MEKSVTLFATAALALVIVGLVLSYGAKITDSVRDSMDSTATDAANETSANTVNRGTNVQLAYTDLVSGSMKTYNATTVVLVPAADYTLDLDNGVFILGANTTASNFSGKNLTFDYQYWVRSKAYVIAQNSTSGLNNLSKNQPLVAVVLAGAVIVGLVLVGFGGFLGGKGRS